MNAPLLIAFVMLAGCTQQTQPVRSAQISLSSAPQPVPVIVKHDFCDEAKPIYLTQKDKLDRTTVDSILAHNRRGVALCGWKP